MYTFGKFQIILSYSSWFAYFLYHFLFRFDTSRSDFTLDEILSSGFTLIFGWNKQELQDVLEVLEQKKLIVLNKQFENYHVHLNLTIGDILSIITY